MKLWKAAMEGFSKEEPCSLKEMPDQGAKPPHASSYADAMATPAQKKTSPGRAAWLSMVRGSAGCIHTQSGLKLPHYVIRFKPPFGIAYPKGDFPTLSMGEGKAAGRLNHRRKQVEGIQGPDFAVHI